MVFFYREVPMAKTNLGSMSVEQLLQLRDDVGKELSRKTVVLREQLSRLGGEIAPSRGRGRSALKGKKVPPKYRDRAGNTWAGRGAKPRWLVAAIKEGKKLEDFAIEKTARKRRAKK
jgi:DNA-binding protein H-NS